MAKTNWQDPKTSEMRSTHVSGLMEAVGKIEDSIGMESVFETNIPLTEVFISSDDRYRIFQAPEGKRNWTSEQPPVIKRNGSVISSGFEIDYGGGAIILNVNDAVANAYTADATYTVKEATDIKAQINSLAPTRVVDGKFEYFDGMEWQRVRGDGYPVGIVTNFSVKSDNAQATLTWTDPNDVTITDSDGNLITIARWGGTKILRKIAGYPANENDGVLVVNSGIKNQYQTNGFVDIGLTNNITYYYSAFSYTTDNVFDAKVDVEVIPTDSDDSTGSPGSRILIAGDMQEGYFGEVLASELITGVSLASQVGISTGTSQFSDAGWLKFAWKGNVQFVAKKTFRHSISWDNINAAGCAFGTKTVVIGGLTYKVRLIRAGTVDPMTTSSGASNHGSEWNRLMLPIHIEAKDKSWAYPNNVESDIPYWGIDFTDGDLHTHNSFGSGSYSWCQETYSSGRVFRGSRGVSYSSSGSPSNTPATCGWRPVLELVA